MPSLDRRGFALLATLWLLAVLAGVAVTVMAAARAERRAAANAASEARARWALSGSLAVLVDDLTDGSAEHSASGVTRLGDSTGTARRIQLNGLEAQVELGDARARLNLNLADSLQLRRLLEVAGLPRDQATALAAAVLDWRDPDDLRRAQGAEAPAYAALRPPAIPRNGPFETAADLAEVFGFTAELVARLKPWVGTSGDGLVNLNTAPAAVLATLPGVSLAGAEGMVARRERGPFQNIFQVLGALPAEEAAEIRRNLDDFQARVAYFPRDLEVTLVAKRRGVVVARQRAVLRGSGGSSVEILRLAQD